MLAVAPQAYIEYQQYLRPSVTRRNTFRDLINTYTDTLVKASIYYLMKTLDPVYFFCIILTSICRRKTSAVHFKRESKLDACAILSPNVTYRNVFQM